MSNQDPSSVARAWLDAFNASDWEKTKSFLSPDSVYEEHGSQRHIEGTDAIMEVYEAWKTAMPDVKGNLTNTYTNGDKVALELTWEGTHTGALVTPAGTIPASGKRQRTPGVMTLEIQAGKIRKSSNYFDMLTFLQQIGAAPAQ
jgi:steroid delta-isomerase-like uncharacterized protein